MDFFKGMLYLIQGLSHLSTPGLKRYILLPIVFNILLFMTSFYLIYHYLFPYSYYYIDKLPSWLSFLSWVILIIFALSFFFLFLTLFTVLFNLFAAPFNGLLAEKAQKLLYQTEVPPSSINEMIIRTIKRQGQFLAYFFPRFLGMIALFFVPFIHFIYPFLWFMFTAWILSVQYHDFVMDNNLINFEQMQGMIKEKKLLSLGFGMSINLLTFVPFLNLITLPAAVIGGVILYFEEYHQIDRAKPKKLT
jgi:CysZ protein